LYSYYVSLSLLLMSFNNLSYYFSSSLSLNPILALPIKNALANPIHNILMYLTNYFEQVIGLWKVFIVKLNDLTSPLAQMLNILFCNSHSLAQFIT
jgi:hypothetical protein